MAEPLLRGVLRTLRYARGWKGDPDVLAEEIEILRDGESVAATLVLPRKRRGPVPGWIALGGISRMGRFHPQLFRFARALASTGAAVLLPDIPEWRRLAVRPGVAAPTVRGCIEALRNRPEVRPTGFGLIGFSFGAPQVALAAAREDLADDVAGVVLFGGYCCLERTVICQMTGHHEWAGVDYALSPDPYGRWVVGANHLTAVPGCEDAGDVAEALYRLACAASDERVSAWLPHHDDMIVGLRESLAAKRRRLFDLFAVPSTAEPPDRDERRDMAVRLAGASRRVEPLLDPAPALGRVSLPARLIHGRGDRLIPFTEGLRLLNGLPASARKTLTVTGLFNHSADQAPPSFSGRAAEAVKWFGTLRAVINTV